MTVTVPVRGPEVSEWQGVTQATEYANTGHLWTSLRTAEGSARLPIDLLTPGRRYTLTLHMGVLGGITKWTEGEYSWALLAGQAQQLGSLNSGQGGALRRVWSFTADREVLLELTNVATATLRVELVAEVPAHTLTRSPLPGDRIALDVMAPRAGGSVFRLDTSRLDRDALTVAQPWPGTFRLGRDRLGAARLLDSDLTEWWVPLADHARAITTARGVGGQVVPVGEVGTLTAEFPNAVDPRALGLRQGAAVRLYDWRERRAIFRGHLTRAVVTPYKPGGQLRHLTTIEAADAVGELAAITRHGAIGVEAWAERVVRLLASAQGRLAHRIAPAEAPSNPTMGNTVLESSLAKHLDVLAASARGAWWVDRDGVVTLCPGQPQGDPVALFTDRRTTEAGAWPYVDAAGGWDWQAVASVVEATNYGAAWDAEQSTWAEANAVHIATNTTLALTYGTQRVQVETNLADHAEAADLAASLVHHQASVADVTAVEVDALTAIPRVTGLDLFTPVMAELRGERHTAYATRLAHTITPHTWVVQVGLTRKAA